MSTSRLKRSSTARTRSRRVRRARSTSRRRRVRRSRRHSLRAGEADSSAAIGAVLGTGAGAYLTSHSPKLGMGEKAKLAGTFGLMGLITVTVFSYKTYQNLIKLQHRNDSILKNKNVLNVCACDSTLLFC